MVSMDQGQEASLGDGPGHVHSKSLVIERSGSKAMVNDSRMSRSHTARSDCPLRRSKISCSYTAHRDALLKEMEMMKEKFSKLLLGEDMSGAGKGVSSALALSNAITNLAASVFGEQKKLEPMTSENRARWKKEMDWLLSVSDHIVEFAPSQQKSANGTSMEIMTTKQRTDLSMNIPALRKLDAMLLDCLDNFKDQKEFYYVSKDANEVENGAERDEKWWLPTVKVPPNGLSEVTKKWMHFQKDNVHQVLKAVMAINAQVLSEMAIPEKYIETLPKNGRDCLGDVIYKSITDEYFDPEQFLATTDLSTEHKIVDLKNRIEASVIIWQRKMTGKDTKSSPWGSSVSLEKRELFEERAKTILVMFKQRFPGICQSSLDISKIQFNRDVGHAILESYSRILESIAHTVLSRIEDVLNADSVAQNTLLEQSDNSLIGMKIESTKITNTDGEIEKLNASGTPSSCTLLEFIGWTTDQKNAQAKTNNEPTREECHSESELKQEKIPYINIPKKSYLENLGTVRSPTARH